jgi:hypothetical protein
MKISAAAAAPKPPPEPIKPQTFSASSAGIYKVNSCDAESGGVCCLQGTLGVKETGQVWGNLTVISRSKFAGVAEKAEDAATCKAFKASINANLKWEGDAAATFSAEAIIASANINMAKSQMFQVMARDPLTNGLVLTNIDAEAPLILNAGLVRTGSLDQGIGAGVVTTPPPAAVPSGEPAGEATAAPSSGTGASTGLSGGSAGSAGSGSFPVAIVGAAAGVLLVGAIVVAQRRNANAASGSAVAAAGHSSKNMVGQYNPHYQNGYQMQQRMY